VIAGLALIGLFVFALPFPLVIGLAAVWGYLSAEDRPVGPRPTFQAGPALRVIAVGTTLWALPLLAVWAAGQTFLLELGLFFSKLAVVTFGGAYAVLTYMTQEVVQSFGWLSTGQMMDALGLAETTPGPLILVTQFVGVVAGSAQGGWALGLTAGLLVLWVTFVPCFIWIFAGAPLIGWLEGRPRLSGALAAITAAVVGVIANLSLWFALHVLFGQVNALNWGPVQLNVPDLTTLNLTALVLMLLAFWALLIRHWPFPWVLALCGGLGLVAGFI
jgi:chromate transporter